MDENSVSDQTVQNLSFLRPEAAVVFALKTRSSWRHCFVSFMWIMNRDNYLHL